MGMAGWVISNCELVDVRSGLCTSNSALVVENGKLAYVGPQTGLPRYAHTLVSVDAQGRWVIPGLIDAHVHVCEEPTPELAKSYDYAETAFINGIRSARNLDAALNAGITLVRDCGSHAGRSLLAKEAISRGLLDGPRVITCGRLLTVPDGHATHLGKLAVTGEEIEAAIEEEVARGADFIKVANYPVFYPLDMLLVVVEAAHNLGKLACCHTGDEESVRLAVTAGFDTIEHAVPFDREMALQMKDQGVKLVPTYYCAHATCADIDLSLISHHELHTIFRPWLRGLANGLPLAFEVGVKVAAGTDAGLPPVTFDALHDELAFLVNAGASPLTALQAATIIGAEACGLADRVGTLEVGKFADFVVLGRNPLEEISATRDIQAVVVGGRIVAGRVGTSDLAGLPRPGTGASKIGGGD